MLIRFVLVSLVFNLLIGISKQEVGIPGSPVFRGLGDGSKASWAMQPKPGGGRLLISFQF